MSNELMVVHERQVHYINLDDDTIESEDTCLDEDVEIEVDIIDVLASQQQILKQLSAIQKKQEKQDRRFDRIHKHTEAIRDVLKVMNRKLPDSSKEVL